MLKAALPLLLLLARATTAQVTITAYDYCTGYVSNAALPPIIYNDLVSSQEQCLGQCDNNAGCVSFAWGAMTTGSSRCNLFSANVEPTSLIPDPYPNFYIAIAWKRTNGSTPTANLPSSGCSTASLTSTSPPQTVSNATVSAVPTNTSSDAFPSATLSANATLTAVPSGTIDANATLAINATSIASAASRTPVPTAVFTAPLNASSTAIGNATLAASSTPTADLTSGRVAPTRSTASDNSSSIAIGTSSSAASSTSSSASDSATSSAAAADPTSSTISTSSSGTGNCNRYTMVYPASSACCPGIWMNLLPETGSRLRRRDDNSTAAAANIVVLPSPSVADEPSSTSDAVPTSTPATIFSSTTAADTPVASLVAPTFPPLGGDSDSSASPSSTSSSSAPSSSASSPATCVMTTIYRTCAGSTQQSNTKDFLDGYRGLSNAPVVVDCGSIGAFTY